MRRSEEDPRLLRPGPAHLRTSRVEPARGPSFPPLVSNWLMQSTGVRHMKTLRTTLNLRKHDVRRLIRRGYEIEYIETRHLDNRDETVVVWTRQTQPDDLAESEVPF